MKKIRMGILAGIILIMLLIPVTRSDAAESADTGRQRIYDLDQLLTEEEKAELEEYAARIVEKYGMENVFVSSLGLDGKTPQAYADDYYDDYGFGIGGGKDGSLLLVDMESRKYHISTCGKAINALTDSRLAEIKREVQAALSDGNYYAAVYSYMSLTEFYYDQYLNGTEKGVGEEPVQDVLLNDNQNQSFVNLYSGWLRKTMMFPLVALFISSIVLIVMAAKHKTAVSRESADDYLVKDSVQFTKRIDQFLRSDTVTRKIEEAPDHNSSTHKSSSGRTHGGSGGSF